MKPFIFLAIALIASFGANAAGTDTVQPLQMLSRETYDPRAFNLSDEDWRWLGKKRVLTVAVWRPEIPPLDMFTQDGKFEGMTADYLMLVSSYLGVKVEVKDFPSRESALNALRNRDVDLMVDSSGKTPPFSGELSYTERFIPDHPVLVHQKISSGKNFTYQPGMRLAIAKWYVDDEWINENFPGVRIMHFDTDEQALASVAFNKNDFFIGNLVTTSYLLDRNFTNYLEFQGVYPERDTGSRFVVRREDEILLRTLNEGLNAIPLAQSKVIMQQWSEGSDIWSLGNSVIFNERERKWIDRHRAVKVSVNAFYAPFTMTDANGNFYGVTADILKLISQRTGIEFIPVPAKSLKAMQQQLDQGEALFIGALSHSDKRNDAFFFTRPYFKSPFVTVTREGETENLEEKTDLRVALVKDNPLAEKFTAEHPATQLIETPNASVAMQNVVEGNADVAVHTLYGASYMINRYFQGKLKIAESIDAPDGEISFAVARNQPELLRILNKALESISPSDISDIIKKWQIRPDVRLNTWELYRTQFWLVSGVAGIIVLTSLLWVYYMRKEISARKKAQTGLQDQLRFNETLINTLPLPVYVTDLDGNLRLCNPSFEAFFSGSSHALLQKGLYEEQHPMHALWLNVTQNITESGDTMHPYIGYEQVFDGEKNRSVLHYAVTFTDGLGLPGGFICTWMDMTEQEELNGALKDARERAEQANRAKSTFLATMSHEIRTPVSAIIGLLELAVKTTQTEADKEDTIRVAWESAKNLMGLIGDILDMARIESGRLELAPEWVRTSDLLPPIVRVFEGLARQKNLQLKSMLPGVMPYEVFLDPLRFRQVLSNLVSNAIKFTEQGHVEVDLDINYCRNDGNIILSVSVSDTGKGISKEEQADIFDPWVQARAGRTQSGSGLGLAICLQLVRMMGGDIRMKSELGKGTTVTFEIPADSHMERREPDTQIEPENNAPHRTLRILAVDDHPANRMLLKHQLLHLGHQVTEAKEGNEAWELWQAQEFDAIITDCSMPGMDGLALTKHIRQHQTRHVTILGLTANAWPEERNKCLHAGMDDCLFKPLQLPQLQAILNTVADRLGSESDCSVQLSDLLSLSDLSVLTHSDNGMLSELLSVTLKSNQEDLLLAEDLYQLEDWPELAKCIHRISGAAQIIGARSAEKHCRSLETLCLDVTPNLHQLTMTWQSVEREVKQLNSCIEHWLENHK
ncbi:transporter substrate-binding domain-containing protein [Enterobacter quasiroggenkampii]|uniref:transporter substrate-binding domain-containing protein n=1 Tax=Enterobacter quasiroggenkampii TaxID=2497436 RepID=UPI0021CDFB4E|nr:transporter substrate-binding domain-containing protein [Enterobacter quasiroggenkampii]MCU6346172.1 transporter substrate-binding domain-containing protein [Enterobacter quasiroggenkampii]